MRGGLQRWKRGVESQGVRQAMAYAFQGSCDSHLRSSATTGVETLAGYSQVDEAGVARFTVAAGEVAVDRLDADQLRVWVDGRDPATDERRGRELLSADADLILDGTINAPKSYSIAALLNPELAAEFEALQDRLRDRIIRTWQAELNARRGAGGRLREPLHRIEVVELRHRRSRALDPHIHRHLWLSVKVQGEDGRWSNVDTRVAMKLHTLINAEGELAARTDPEWITALARHGYTLDADGEITELAHAVRPLSRRSTQIEANRALLLADWHTGHPGQTAGPDVLKQVDRLAWAKARPDKPDALDETAWETLIRDELTDIDPAIVATRPPTAMAPVPVGAVDRDLLAARAIVDADQRATSTGARFSMFDIRAGATRAVAASGVVAPRQVLQELIDDITARAATDTVDLLGDEPDRPGHVKAFMAAATAALKVDLAARLDALTTPGATVDPDTVDHAAQQVLPADAAPDPGQRDAAAAIAGTDRLVSVTGPAGAGKTTMLRITRVLLARQGRRMVVVAPTRKAATVAAREIGATTSSLHALLADHGWRWGHDDADAPTWTRLSPGTIDPTTGHIYDGPRRFPLQPGDRVVVDEAGMVDLHTAHALTLVCADTGAGIAMVGDHLQAMPVGHSGAMTALTRRATAVVELTNVHRFRDPDYAALTLQLRDPNTRDTALAVAAELQGRGLVRHVPDAGAARQAMVDAYFREATGHRRVALVTGTNDEADAINEAIQQRRLEGGDLHQRRIAVGQGEQRLLEGDTVQTRRNDTHAAVENRAVWTIRHITPDTLELASPTDPADTRTVTRDYATEHIHLAYASTVHGIQGETTDVSVVGPGVDAAGLYVGMTRGRERNEAITIARTPAAARDALADSMMRGTPEVSIDDSIRAARTELNRAARTPDTAPTWNDRARRPYGHIENIHRLIATTEAAAADARAAVHRSADWIDNAQRLLHAMNATASSGNARSHATPDTVEPDPRARTLSARLADQRDAHEDLLTVLDDATSRMNAAHLEHALRRNLSPAQHLAETRARQTATVQPHTTSSGPSLGL
ncbi:AAA family ATPase [Microbacter sp. GSS18]|nr:AAA family ATPase [Microbacter sp. GSS18]